MDDEQGREAPGLCGRLPRSAGDAPAPAIRTRGEANDFRITVENQIRSGTYRPDADKVTVAALADVFLDHCRGRMERGERMTRRNFQVYEGYVRNYICPNAQWHEEKHSKPQHQFQPFEKGIGLRKLSQLTVGMVTKFRDDLREAGLSVATTRKIIAMLQVMLAYGISLDLIAVNAAEGVRVIGRRDEASKRINPPSKEVMRAIIALADDNARVLPSPPGIHRQNRRIQNPKHVENQLV